MIYLIGGPARCGKSTLSTRVQERIKGHFLVGDAFVGSLQENLQPEWVPDLFVHHGDNAVQHATMSREKLKRLRQRDRAAWSFYEAYIRKIIAHSESKDILLEGNIWPDFIATLDIEHRAVFLVDTSENQAERLKEIRDGNGSNNWMRDFSDEKIIDWAQFNILRSSDYVKLCEQYGYPCFDIADAGIEKASDDAFRRLVEL